MFNKFSKSKYANIARLHLCREVKGARFSLVIKFAVQTKNVRKNTPNKNFNEILLYYIKKAKEYYLKPLYLQNITSRRNKKSVKLKGRCLYRYNYDFRFSYIAHIIVIPLLLETITEEIKNFNHLFLHLDIRFLYLILHHISPVSLFGRL